MITVQVRLYATLRDQFPGLAVGEAMAVTLPDEATVGQLIRHLSLPDDQVKVLFVNHVVRGVDHQLKDGDTIGIFPPVGGG